MKKTLVVLASVMYLVLACLSQSPAEELAPDKLISKSWELFRRAKYEKESVRIVMTYADGRNEEKRLIRWTRFDPGSEDCITIKFSAPPLDRGLGLLTLRHADREDEQWLKLPSLKKVRKIAAGEHEKYFAGTDLTNEDIRRLIGERVQDHSYTLVKSEAESSVIEAVPRAGIETGYGRRLIWVDAKFVIRKVEYYGKNGERVKIQTNSGITISDKGLWRTDHVEMDNLLLKRKTLVDIEQREIDQELSSGIFSRDFLESERM